MPVCYAGSLAGGPFITAAPGNPAAHGVRPFAADRIKVQHRRGPTPVLYGTEQSESAPDFRCHNVTQLFLVGLGILGIAAAGSRLQAATILH